MRKGEALGLKAHGRLYCRTVQNPREKADSQQKKISQEKGLSLSFCSSRIPSRLEGEKLELLTAFLPELSLLMEHAAMKELGVEKRCAAYVNLVKKRGCHDSRIIYVKVIHDVYRALIS